MRSTHLAVIACLCFALAPASAGTEEPHARPAAPGRAADSPRIVLVLSGGGARGAAHIGVLKALEEMRVPIAAIAGTSMGAVVGGLYAAGWGPDELEALFESVDWETFFIDDPDRALFRFRRKREDQDYLVRQAAGIRTDGLRLPPGVVHGQKVMSLLTRRTLHVADRATFDELPIPFRAVATDIATAQPVVMSDGSLAEAMYASMAIPAIVAPVPRDGRLLVDGGVSNNLPVDAALSLGADVILAVDVSSPLLRADDMTSVFAVTEQLTNVLTRRTTVEQMKRLRPRDVLITPDLGDVTALDFVRADAAIPAGREATLGASARLATLAVSRERHGAWRAGVRRAAQADEIEIAEVVLESESGVAPSVLERVAGVEAGRHSIDQVENAVDRLYGTTLFSHVSYEYATDGRLTLRAHPKPWGPYYVQFGLALEDDFEGRNAYTLGLAFTATELNPAGGEWRSEVGIGERPRLHNELHQPLGRGGEWFVAPALVFDGFNRGVFDDGELDVLYRIRRYLAGLDVGRELGTTGEWRAGITTGSGLIERIVGDAPMRSDDADTGRFTTTLAYDSLDNLHFPRGGHAFEASWTLARSELGAQERYDAWAFSASTARTWGQHTGFGSVSLRHVYDGTSPLHEKSTLGGFLNLSGLEIDRLVGDDHALLAVGYRFRWLSSPVLPAWVGASIEVGNVWDGPDDPSFADMIVAGSLFLGFDTLLGPLYVAGGLTEDGDNTLYVQLGRPR